MYAIANHIRRHAQQHGKGFIAQHEETVFGASEVIFHHHFFVFAESNFNGFGKIFTIMHALLKNTDAQTVIGGFRFNHHSTPCK